MQTVDTMTFDELDAIENVENYIPDDDSKSGCAVVSLPCDVCERDIVRAAVTVNDVKICHNCLRFFHAQAKMNNRTWKEEVQYQTGYIKGKRSS